MKPLIIFFLFISLSSISLQAQNSFKIINKPYIHQQIGCDAFDGFQVGNYIYLIEDNLIVVVDVSNPVDMKMVTGIEVEASHHGHGVLNEKYLTMGRKCINISNPRKPFTENCNQKKQTPSVYYKSNKKGLSVQCKVERGFETIAYLPLPEVEVIIDRHGTHLFQINENLLAVFFDNLHFIDVSAPEDPKIVATYTYNIPNAPRTVVRATEMYDKNTLCVFTNCGIDFIDIEDLENPMLKGHYLFDYADDWSIYKNIKINKKQQRINYVKLASGAEGYETAYIMTLKHQDFQAFEEETIFYTTNGYATQYVQPLQENQRYSFYIQLDQLIAVDNYYGKVIGRLALGNRLSGFDINEHYAFACGRNGFDSKFIVYQNNGQGHLELLNVIRDDYQNACISVSDSLLAIGSMGIGGTFEGFDFQIYDLLNILSPTIIFNSKPSSYQKPNSVLAYRSITLKNGFLITDAQGFYHTRGHWFIVYDLTLPQSPQIVYKVPCEAGYNYFQFDNTDFWIGLRHPHKNRTVHLAYPIFKNNKVEILQSEYQNFEAMTKDSTIENSVRKAVKKLYDWNALPTPKEDEFPYLSFTVHKGYVYELQRYKGMRIYKVEEYYNRFLH